MDVRSLSGLVVALLVAGCGDNEPGTFADPDSIEVVSMPTRGGGALDLLLVLDDSGGGEQWQTPLGETFDRLLDPLQAAAGTLDLHIGVTSTDLGTTALGDPAHPGPAIGQLGNGGCAGSGRDGALTVTGAPVTDRFLADGPTPNFTGARSAALRTMFTIGAGGCGFEQPLAASVRAFSNPANAGFRRPGANLLVLHAGDEDDCSIADPALLGPESATLGPVQSFRCTRFGVACDEDVSTVGTKHACHPATDTALVSGVDPFVEEYRRLVPDPARLVVASIAGPPVPFAVEPRTPPGGGTAIAALAHACMWTGAAGDTQVADPGVRLSSFVQQFGAHGAFRSLCDRDFGAHLGEIARVAKQMFGVACLDTTKLRDSDTLAGVQPSCGAVLVVGGVEQPLPACPAAGPCFEIALDAAACAETADHARFVVHDAPADAYVRARCEVP